MKKLNWYLYRLIRKIIDIGIHVDWKNRGLKIGRGSWINYQAILKSPENITIGEHVHINEKCYLSASFGNIVIENNITLSPYVKLVCSGYDLEKFYNKSVREHFEGKTIYIASNNWICMGAMILPGVHITGNHVVVAAGAIVTEDITESHCLYAGVPAKMVKKYEPMREN